MTEEPEKTIKTQMSIAETSPARSEAPKPGVLYDRSIPLTRDLLMRYCYFDHAEACIILHRGTDPSATDNLRLRTVSVDFLLAHGLDDIALLEGKILRVIIEDPSPNSPTVEEIPAGPDPLMTSDLY